MPSSPTPPPHRARAAAVLAALLLTVTGLVLASPASAHDELVSTDPAADAALDALPAELTMTFSAEIATDAGATELQVTDAAGTSLAQGAPVVASNVVTQSLSGEASGTVTVLWKVVSSDGHPISGEFSFTVAGTATPAETASATPTPTPSETETAAPPAPVATEGPLPEPPMQAVDMTPWIVAGLLLLAAIGGAVLYLLVSRARRRKALDER